MSGIVALTMVVSGALAVDNILANPNFDEGLEGGWIIGCLDYGAAGEISIEPGVVGDGLFARIDSLGNDGWEPEIHSPDFALDLGETYTVDFWAKIEPGITRDLGVKFEQLDLWGGPMDTVAVTDQWEHHYLTLVVDFQSPPNSVIHIQFEGSTASIWFDQFRVYQGEHVASEPLGSVTPMGRLATAWGQIKSR